MGRLLLRATFPCDTELGTAALNSVLFHDRYLGKGVLLLPPLLSGRSQPEVSSEMAPAQVPLVKTLPHQVLPRLSCAALPEPAAAHTACSSVPPVAVPVGSLLTMI